MSLPKNCLYKNKINSSYAKNYQSVIQPQNGNDATFGDTIIFNIPTGNNLVMSGADTILKFDFTIKGTAATGNAVNTVLMNKSGGYSCIQRMRLFHGGTLLSDIDNYGNLLDMLISAQQSTDSLASKYKILAGTDIGGGASLTITTLAADSERSVSYCLPLMSILSLTNNYVPLFAMSGSPLRLELQVVSNINQICKSFVQVASPTAKSVLSRIELVCNMIELSDTGMNIIKNAIGNGPLQWVTQDYRNYGNNVVLSAGSDTTVTVPVPAKFNSLNSLFFSFRQNAAGVWKHQANESTKFDLDEYFLRIGSRTFPAKSPNTVSEFYSELLRAFGTVSDVNYECSISLEQYNKDFPVIQAGAEGPAETVQQNSGAFYIGMDLESYSNTSMDTVYTGTNTSTDDIFFTTRFGAQGSAAYNVRIDSYALYDQLILIQNGVCSVNN